MDGWPGLILETCNWILEPLFRGLLQAFRDIFHIQNQLQPPGSIFNFFLTLTLTFENKKKLENTVIITL